MVIFLCVLLILGIGLELYSILDGLKHISFDYYPEESQVEQEKPVTVTAEVTNSGMMPIAYVRAEISYPVGAVLPEGMAAKKEQFAQTVDTVFRLWGRQQVRRKLTVQFIKRGVHHFKGAVVHRGDFLGLQLASEQFVQHRQILVFPKCLDRQDLRSAMGAFYGDMIARRHLLQDPILTMGVREYTGREAMKTISWSQSARRGQLMVREFDYTRDLSCTVLLAADGIMPTSEQRLDLCCSMVRTVCQELCQRNVNVAFYTNGLLLGQAHEKSPMWSCVAQPGQQEDLLRALALLYPAPVRSPADHMAVSAARAAGKDTAFVVVAPFDCEPVQKAVRILGESSGMPVLLLLASEFAE